MLSALWAQEPAVVTVIGSVAFWKALFALFAAFGHGLSQQQEEAVSGFAVLLAGYIIRTQVTPTAASAAVPAAAPTTTTTTLPKAMWLLPLLLTAALAGAACHTNLTPTQQISNVTGQVLATTDQILLAAQALNVSNPTVMTKARLDQVALVADKIGSLGADLSAAIDAYNAAKLAGSDTSKQVAAVQAGVGAITQALSDLGKQIPQGTVAAIDAGVTTILGLLAQLQVGGL